ncbi:MAG: ATP-grasp domain-containing protein [Lachnospiraceae bacterium]|nr:ATP-grasp domain-containing protein [Lachnospiraceae bacterium]
MKKIMILGAGILQLPAIETARKMELEVIAVDMNPEAVGFKVPGVIKEVISTIDTPAIVESAKKHHIDGIMTLATDMPMQSVAAVCHEMGLIGISEDTALKATNKAFMRDALKESGVPVPLYFRVKGKNEYKAAVSNVRSAGFKCILKPADNSGSRGVSLLEPGADLDKAFDYTAQFSRGGEIVVEEFMEGPEVSVETMAVGGDVRVIQITDKLTTGAPYFVEMGHSQPSQLSGEIKRKIAEISIAANRAIGIQNGPSHTEIKVTKEGPKIVELGARLGGDCITTHLVPLSTGVDMVKCCIQIALGEQPDLEPKWKKGSAIRYLETGKGVVKAVSGAEDAEKIPGVVQASIVHGVGERVGEIRSSGDRAGFVIAQADSVTEAVEACEKGKSLIEIQLENDLQKLY